MAIVSPLRTRGTRRPGRSRDEPGDVAPAQPRKAGLSSWFAALHDALERPLTSYYLLLGASALLLTIGLIMVFSASSVYAFQNYDGDSYAVVVKQLTWVAIGLPCAWVAGRLPQRWIRRLAWPGYVVSVLLLLLTAFVGVSRNGNTNWLALGPIVIQPSEIAKLALVLWAAHVYANKDRRLGNLHQIMMPVVPGPAPGHRPGGLRPRPRHRAGALRDPARHALGGRCARPFLRPVVPGGLGVRRRSRRGRPRAAHPDHDLHRPDARLQQRGVAARPRALRAVERRTVRAGDRGQPAEVGQPARPPTPTSSSRCSARSSGWSARCW